MPTTKSKTVKKVAKSGYSQTTIFLMGAFVALGVAFLITILSKYNRW